MDRAGCSGSCQCVCTAYGRERRSREHIPFPSKVLMFEDMYFCAVCPQAPASGIQPKEESRLFHCWRESWLRDPFCPQCDWTADSDGRPEGSPLAGETGWGVSRASGPRRQALWLWVVRVAWPSEPRLAHTVLSVPGVSDTALGLRLWR